MSVSNKPEQLKHNKIKALGVEYGVPETAWSICLCYDFLCIDLRKYLNVEVIFKRK
jgi:hypothetical protein